MKPGIVQKIFLDHFDLYGLWVMGVAVGMPVARHPPHRSVHDGSPSYGSYLEYLASNRSHGRGCFT
jgi:hypothetical protein